MAFRFTLEAVLRLRQSLEDRELLRLQTLLARRAALLHELEELQRASLKLQEQTGQTLLQQLTAAAEIHFAMVCLHALDRRQQLSRDQLHDLEPVIAGQRLLFEQQRRNRQLLETLRDTQLRDYRLVQQRREQARLDEMHLLRSKSAIGA